MADLVQTPADYVPLFAIATGEEGQPAVPVSTEAPLPTMPMGADEVFYLPRSAEGLNTTVVKTEPGRLFTVIGNNASHAVRYLKLWDATEKPNVGTDKPLMCIALAAQSQFAHRFDGLRFRQGIAFAFTGMVGNGDKTSIPADDIEAFNMVFA